MKNTLTLTRPQADALARLLRIHLEAYDEAVCPAESRRETEPLTGSDLDLLEPLLPLLEVVRPLRGRSGMGPG